MAASQASVVGSIPIACSRKKQVERLAFFLSKPQAWYIITQSVYIINHGKAVVGYHHGVSCAFPFLRLDDIHDSVVMRYNPCGLDDMQGFALIYLPKYDKIVLERSDFMAKNYLLEYSEQLATEIERLCRNIKAPSNTLFQIRKSSSSVYANIREANYGQSKADMLSKFEIATKECSETEGWLKLLFNSNDIDEDTYKKHRNLCGRIRRMLIASCKTLKDTN